MREITVRLHEISVDGPPNLPSDTQGGDPSLIGRVAFLFDGEIVGGWPLSEMDGNGYPLWEADSDVGKGGKFGGVTHWVEFPQPLWELEKRSP